MPAALNLYRRASVPQRLHALAAVTYLVVFAAVVLVGRPGLGVGQGFYVPILLAGLGGTVATGIGAGIVAALLYAFGLALAGVGADTELSSLRTAIHLVTYVAAGAIAGHFATRARLIVGEALHTLDNLLHLARRDLDSGALNARGLEATLTNWMAAGASFALLVGELTCGGVGEAETGRIHRELCARVDANAEVARVGPAQFAVVTWLHGDEQARTSATEFERALAERGCRATFGWAVYPLEGSDGISLFRAAGERLYARRVVRGEWTPTPASAGLADEPA